MPKSKRRKRSKNKSGYIGVTKASSGKYEAYVHHLNGKYKHIGSYDTAKQAAKAYDREAIKIRKPLSSLNYPKKAPVGYTPIQFALRSDNTVGYRGVAVAKNKSGKKFVARSQIVVNIQAMVHTIQQKKLPLPTIALFSKPTNSNLF